MAVTLYHWEPNANSGKPMLTLAEYLAINPDGTIPAMVHGTRVLTESTRRASSSTWRALLRATRCARRCGRRVPIILNDTSCPA